MYMYKLSVKMYCKLFLLPCLLLHSLLVYSLTLSPPPPSTVFLLTIPVPLPSSYPEYKCHVYVRSDKLACVVIADMDYPQRVCFTLMNKVSLSSSFSNDQMHVNLIYTIQGPVITIVSSHWMVHVSCI